MSRITSNSDNNLQYPPSNSSENSSNQAGSLGNIANISTNQSIRNENSAQPDIASRIPNNFETMRTNNHNVFRLSQGDNRLIPGLSSNRIEAMLSRQLENNVRNFNYSVFDTSTYNDPQHGYMNTFQERRLNLVREMLSDSDPHLIEQDDLRLSSVSPQNTNQLLTSDQFSIEVVEFINNRSNRINRLTHGRLTNIFLDLINNLENMQIEPGFRSPNIINEVPRFVREAEQVIDQVQSPFSELGQISLAELNPEWVAHNRENGYLISEMTSLTLDDLVEREGVSDRLVLVGEFIFDYEELVQWGSSQQNLGSLVPSGVLTCPLTRKLVDLRPTQNPPAPDSERYLKPKRVDKVILQQLLSQR